MTVAGQPAVTFGYDNANRLLTITQGSNVVTVTYDAAGRRTSVMLPNGVVTEYTYDAASRVTGLTYRKDTTTLGTLSYTYDAASNRVQVGGTWARTALPPALDSASYDAANRHLTFGGQVLAYDLNGNLLSDGTSGYTWDARNRLTGITAGPITATFQYDATGRRTRKTINGVTTDFVHDGINPVTESSAGGTGFLLTGLGVDDFMMRIDPVSTSMFLTDALGSTVAMTNAAGNVQTEYSYEPFGAATVSGASSGNEFNYTGREDDATGLYYYRARYYYPQLGRFISEDPIGFKGGDVNLYAYVRNSPSQLIDPLGLTTWPGQGSVRSGYGYRDQPQPGFHYGIDIRNNYGAPVVASDSGRVVNTTPVACTKPSAGPPCNGPYNQVTIEHPDGSQTRYFHTYPYLTPGSPVDEGQIIGHTDLSGKTTGPHVHYEYRPPGGSGWIDPSGHLSGANPYPYPNGMPDYNVPGYGGPEENSGMELDGRKDP